MIKLVSGWLTQENTDRLVAELDSLSLDQRAIKIQDREIAMPRLTGWCNDFEFGYRYSGQETPVMPWPTLLKQLRDTLQDQLDKRLPAVLINKYRDGNDSVGWHRDNEEWFRSDPFIVSVSLGATRTFNMRNRTRDQKASFDLANGDLLVFSNEHVLDWEHTIPKTTKPVGVRYNLTFRTIIVS